MKAWIRKRLPNHRLCLVHTSRGNLVTWVCLAEISRRLSLSAWTLRHHRRKGYARVGADALLERMRVSKKRPIKVYSSKTYKLLKDLGYRPGDNGFWE